MVVDEKTFDYQDRLIEVINDYLLLSVDRAKMHK